jgi:folylpolyglutamate synthase/dihydropteroate synthase
VATAVRRVEADRAPEDRVTQFEALTAAAFVELGRHPVEVAVVEAGLGGRLDATNVIGSEVQALTSLGLEHTRLLGSTYAEIAAEKLDVVRRGATLVLGPELPAEVEQLAAGVASARGARLVRAPRPSRTAGSFQDRNFAVAERCARALLGALDPAATRAAAAVRTPGQLEVVGRAPLTVLDAAHNPHGARALAAALPGVLARAASTSTRRSSASCRSSPTRTPTRCCACSPRCASTAMIATGNTSDRARDPYEAGRPRSGGRRPAGRRRGGSPSGASDGTGARRSRGHRAGDGLDRPRQPPARDR